MSKGAMRSMMSISVVAGLFVAVGLYRLVASRNIAEANTPFSVVIARTPLQRGTILTNAHVGIGTLPRANRMMAGSFTATQSVVGRIVKDLAIQKGTPILESSLVPADRPPLMREMVPPGYRAVGVFVDGRGDIERFLRSFDHVDVVVTMEDEGGIPSSKVLLQDMIVLAVPETQTGTTHQGTHADSVPVTLAVTPADGEKLSLAMRVGTIQLLVRGRDDGQPTQTSGVTKDTLLPPNTGLNYQAQDGSSTTYRTVEVIKGQERHRERFRESLQPNNAGGAS